MKEDILAGLRNALERGQSLESASQSFINAGYNPRDVQEAASSISQGVTSIISKEDSKFQPLQPQIQPPKQTDLNVPESPSTPINPTPLIDPNLDKKKKHKKILVILLIILLVLIALLIGVAFFAEKLLQIIAG